MNPCMEITLDEKRVITKALIPPSKSSILFIPSEHHPIGALQPEGKQGSSQECFYKMNLVGPKMKESNLELHSCVYLVFMSIENLHTLQSLFIGCYFLACVFWKM